MTVSQALTLFLDGIQSEVLRNVLAILITISPIFLLIVMFVIFWEVWVNYIRSREIFGMKTSVLELRLPKDTYKNPLAMETFLQSLHNTAGGSWYLQYWKGSPKAWFSLELVSIEGTVKFFIWTASSRKANLISSLYSQFPEIEIYEREDYTKSVHFDPKTMKIWAGEMILTKEDAYPIKTYVDYGLDKDPKEEFKVDPLTPLIEYLGSVPANQQVWIQILIMAHQKVTKPGKWFKTHDQWENDAKKLVNEILKRDEKTKVAGTEDKDGIIRLPSISEGERETVKAIERSLHKHPFDVGIRALYIAPKDQFSASFGIGGIIGNFKHFSSNQLNGFKTNGKVWHMRLEFPWQDYKDIRANKYSAQGLDAYKRRSYFYTPYDKKPIVLNSEELATIYHFPGAVSATPNLERVPSKKSGAPANLPI